MTIEEYKTRENQIEKDYSKYKNELYYDYAMSNNTYYKGDRVTDHIGTILIDEIKVGLSSLNSIPSCCLYYGFELNGNGEIKKSMKRRCVYGSNVINEQT